MAFDKTLISQIVSKLGTWGLALVLVAIISSFAALLSAAIFNNVPIVYENGKISIGNKDIAELNREIGQLQEKIESSIEFSSLADMSSSTFQYPLTREKVKNKIQNLIDIEKAKSKHDNHYAYKLFLIEVELQDNGGRVDTKVEDASNEKLINTYKLIQDVLRRLNYYKGNTDGNQKGTYEALVSFQRSVTNIPASDYGIFGSRTLEAIRSRFKTSS